MKGAPPTVGRTLEDIANVMKLEFPDTHDAAADRQDDHQGDTLGVRPSADTGALLMGDKLERGDYLVLKIYLDTM